MLHPKYLQIHDYTYHLPEDKIASFPLPGRDSSKLLIYKNDILQQDIYANISMHIPDESLLIFNNTKVIKARVLFQKPSGGVIEIFALEPAEEQGYHSVSLHNKGNARWKCLIGGAGKWKHGRILHKQISINTVAVNLTARIVERLTDCFMIEFIWQPEQMSFFEMLNLAGSVPVPPYLKRNAEVTDSERYQTIYASRQGSVAAPTAGLHFTEKIFRSLTEKKTDIAYVTLHVGAGTFLPVKSETMEGHTMHAEHIEAEATFIQKLVDHSNNIFAVGTTSLRTIESLYWMGVKCLLNPEIPAHSLAMTQWEAYEMKEAPVTEAGQALGALQKWMKKKELERLTIRTQLLIAPPYRPRVARGLITNFHQPGSTLLLLVAAVTGDNWKKIYDYALQHDFRFLSYGDGCLLYFD